MTITQTLNHITQTLTPVVGADEARAMARAILQDLKGYTTTELAMHGGRELLPETQERISRIVTDILSGTPMQYAVGKAHFHGRVFKVNPAVLIPRPETSQLIDIIVKDWGEKSDLSVLDIGTGSGCIAISLALDLPFSHVTALDISPEAIKVAKENAMNLKAKVELVEADILKAMPDRTYNIIVSNPPYIMEKEKAQMDSNVLDHEPYSALFVPDNDPLLFYKAIANYATFALDPDGTLYFEINPLCAQELKTQLKYMRWKAEIMRDYKGNMRFMVCKKA